MAQGYCQRTEDGSTKLVLAITQEELVQMVGVSRRTTNRILNDLKERRVLRFQRCELKILNLLALRA